MPLKHYLTAPFMLMTAFILVFYPEMVWAQSSTAGSGGALKSMSEITSYSVQVITAAAHFLIQYMPALWGTDLITGPQVIAGIKPMWMFIRNFVNLVMVLVLLFIVFANLVTAGGEIGGGKLKDWTIKDKLPKLIFTLVAVNFTIMGIKIMADGVYVATVALFSIGDQAVVARGGESIEDMYSMMVDTKKFEKCEGGGGNCKPVRKIINDVYCPSGDVKKDPCLFKMRDSINVGQLLDPAKKNIMVAFGHYVMHLEMLPVVAAQKDFLSVLDNAVFSLVMAVAYVLAMIASFVALLVRVIMIWVFILISPLLVAGLVMGLGKELETILQMLMKFMFLPMKIAAAFAFSFVMISVVETISPSPTNFASTMEPGPPLVPFWGLDGWGWIWKILTVVLFWKAIFDFALKDVPGLGGVIGKIRSMGEGMATSALRGVGNQAKLPGGQTATSMVDKVGGTGARLKRANQAQQNRNAFGNTEGDKKTSTDRLSSGLKRKNIRTTEKLIEALKTNTEFTKDNKAIAGDSISQNKVLENTNIPKADWSDARSQMNTLGKGAGKAFAKKVKSALNEGSRTMAESMKSNFDSSGELNSGKSIDSNTRNTFNALSPEAQNSFAKVIAGENSKNWGKIADILRGNKKP